MNRETVARYNVDNRTIKVDLCWEGNDVNADTNRFYDIYGEGGECLNLGDPWHDDGQGVPTLEDVKCLVGGEG
jgi:hypothetical protein